MLRDNISEMRKDRGKVTGGEPIGTHQRSFERYHPDPPIRSPVPTILGVRNPQPKPKTPVAIISGTGEDTDFKLGHRVTGSIEQKPINNGEKGAWAYPGTAQTF